MQRNVPRQQRLVLSLDRPVVPVHGRHLCFNRRSNRGLARQAVHNLFCIGFATLQAGNFGAGINKPQRYLFIDRIENPGTHVNRNGLAGLLTVILFNQKGNPLLQGNDVRMVLRILQKQLVKGLLLLAGGALLLLALARIQSEDRLGAVEVKRTGVDILIALDTSQSMLAEDIKPSRLLRAKQEITGLLTAGLKCCNVLLGRTDDFVFFLGLVR